MTVFNDGEKVVFKGQDEVFTIVYVNEGSDSYDLENNVDGMTIEYVPARLLDPAPEDFKPGDVVQDALDSIFIVGSKNRVHEEVYAFVDENSTYWSSTVDELEKPVRKIGHVSIDSAKVKKGSSE